MEIVVNGRNSEISERFREHVREKLQRLDKFDQRQKISRVEVEVTHEKTSRPDCACRVEVTIRSRGPVVRGEACSTDQHSALDAVVDKLEARLRKLVDRQRIHRGHRKPTSLAEATAVVPDQLLADEPADDGVHVRHEGSVEVVGEGPLVVREKTHESEAMTLDQALSEMELVGHDFFLFVEKDSMLPSVVYRRHGYDYGVIHLRTPQS
ncbi:ribosome-associated translation inhibitor RaiA [Aeromicrobium sp. IC_218]|nr:ribosome-associated translation inhibitor RaiA [Aeromicrobium sp. IC_218]TCI95700.1 ribosome-associated translation inhibitor RaiA [Aeromicrobium sp. IC_218]